MAGKDNRLRYSAINPDLSLEVVGLARLKKPKMPTSQKLYVVVGASPGPITDKSGGSKNISALVNKICVVLNSNPTKLPVSINIMGLESPKDSL
jgi:hypothetical protein